MTKEPLLQESVLSVQFLPLPQGLCASERGQPGGEVPSTTLQTASGARRGRRTKRGKNTISTVSTAKRPMWLQRHLSGMAAAPRGRHRPCPRPRSHQGLPSDPLQPSAQLPSHPVARSIYLVSFISQTHTQHSRRPGTNKGDAFHPQNHPAR